MRLASGARPSEALGLIVWQAFRLVSVGLAIGVLPAVGITRLLRTLLVGVQPDSPLMIAAVAVLLVAVGLAAAYLPARRASKVDPMVALRHE
jgi:putative ABC transport system permease protein